jgi:hypothetical protein
MEPGVGGVRKVPDGGWSTSLNAVSANSAGGYWAVGDYLSASKGYRALLARCS